MTRRTAAAQFAAFVVVLGIPDGALGVLWPSLRASFHRPLGDLGFLAVAGTVLYVVGGAAFTRLVGRTGTGRLVWWSCAGATVLTAVWATAGSWGVVLVAVGAFGLARGLLDAAVNAGAVTDVRALGWLHAGWAVGGALGPLLVTALVSGGGWRLPVGVLAAACALVTIACAAPAPRRARGPAAGAAAAAGSGGSRAGGRGLAVVLLAFAVYTAAEAGPCAWGYVYLTDDRALGTRPAAFAVAGFWVALTAGRVALGLRGERVDAARALHASAAAFALGLAALWLAPVPVAAAGLTVAGLGSAAMFPLFVALTPQRTGLAAAEHVVGLSVATAAVGGPLAVLAEGQLAGAAGTAVLGPALLTAAGLLYVVVWLMWRRPGEHRPGLTRAAG